MAKSSIPVGPLIIFIIGIIAVVAIWRNKHLFDFGPPVPSVSVPAAAISPEPTCPAGEECVSSNNGTRMECDEPKGDSYEATWCGSFSGDRMSIKLYGPPHSNDGDCCWCELPQSMKARNGLGMSVHPD